MAINKTIEESLHKVQEIILQVVREEQLRDKLTHLPNDDALTETITQQLQDSNPFWIAFIEIDKFKSINDKFGYENADIMLKRVADHLEQAARDYFAPSKAFRAHGDEFYILGFRLNEVDSIEESLHTLRDGISKIKIPVSQKNMQATVSIGWATSQEFTAPREIKLALEAAVSHAKKLGRNRVVRYSEDIKKSDLHSMRDDCPTCKTSFTADIRLDEYRSEELYCPNCGARIARGPLPPLSPAPTVSNI